MRYTLIAAAALISLSTNALAQTACPSATERTAYLMGTTMRVSVCGEREQAVAAIEAGFAEVARLEQVLSSWKPTTEIGRINGAAPGSRIDVSAELASLLAEAATWVRETDGAFDPAVGALIDAWGFRSEPRVPARPVLARARAASGWHYARLDGTTIVRGPAGWWLDTGGFGKGAALRAAARVLRERGVQDAVLDFGGQLQVIGRAVDVSVADPVQRDRATTSLRISNASVATSSQSERFIDVGGHRYGHILDPRTGEPVKAWGSVTVIAADALVADALSTALFVMGPTAARAWAEQHPDVGVLMLESGTNGMQATHSRGMNQWIIEEN